MRYIIVGDTHIRHNPPTFRNDGFYASLRDKLGQIRRLSEEHSASVIVLGDFFDRAVQGELERIVADNIDSIRGWHTLIGNHDTRSSDGSLYGTSLGLLVSLGIVSIMPDNGLFDVFHYHDRNDYGRRPSPGKYALVHDYILPEGVRAMYEHRKCAENGYSYVFIGHYHLPFDIRIGHTRFVNPGSLMRLTADEIRLDRTPEVLLLDTDTDTLTHIPVSYTHLTLPTICSV